MDNLSKALYMAAGLFLFIMALTSSVFLYNRVIEIANLSIALSDMGDRAEYAADMENVETQRPITRAEIIASIMQKDSLFVDEIVVDGDSDPNLDSIKKGIYNVEYSMDTDGSIERIEYTLLEEEED